MTVIAGFLERINPVFLKEVRAALRARVFRILFQIVMFGSVTVAVIALANVDVTRDVAVGRDFFVPIYVCLCVAILGLVPLSAFFNMGSEWDENTYDLLAISNLRPRQIVLGKLFSSTIETLLYFSAFAPLLVFAFLLRGLDIRVILIVLGATFLLSVGASATAIGLSSLSRTRVWRLLLLLLTAAGTLVLVIAAGDVVWTLFRRSFPGSWNDNARALVAIVIGAGVVGLTVACERLAHPEENHSTAPRVVVTVCWAAFLTWAVWIASSRSMHQFYEAAAFGLFLTTLAQVFFATERETLSRRVRNGVPRQGWLAFLAAPFLPGGGRALLLFGVHVLMGLLAGMLASAIRGPVTGPMAGAFFPGSTRYLVFAGYFAVYLAIITLPFSFLAAESRWRWIARVTLPLLVLATIFLPAFVDFLLSKQRRLDMKHGFNPFDVLDGRHSGFIVDWLAYAVEGLVVIAFLVNVGRFCRAIQEVMEASRENRLRPRSTA